MHQVANIDAELFIGTEGGGLPFKTVAEKIGEVFVFGREKERKRPKFDPLARFSK